MARIDGVIDEPFYHVSAKVWDAAGPDRRIRWTGQTRSASADSPTRHAHS